MRIIGSLTRRSLRLRVATFLMLLVVGAMALGARCIDRTSTFVDADGYTHITGEMVNDTNVQGTKIMLVGTLLNGDAVVAQKVSPTCPPDTQPNNQTTFDIRFDNPNLPPWTRFDVRPISGTVISSPLPDPHVVLFKSEAIRFTVPLVLPGLSISTKDVLFGFDVRNQTNATYPGVQFCGAVYDQSGNIVFVSGGEVLERTASGGVAPATLAPQQLTSIFGIARNVPVGPVQVRGWLWFGSKNDPTSAYAFVSTGLVTIQSISP